MALSDLQMLLWADISWLDKNAVCFEVEHLGKMHLGPIAKGEQDSTADFILAYTTVEIGENDYYFIF